MEAAYQWGIDLIRSIQTIQNPVLTALMKGITFLGSEYAYILLMLIIFWSIDERRGARLGTILIFSGWLNGALKAYFMHPRPYELDPRVGLAYEPSYGIPSGHAQQSLLVWPIVASWFGKKRYYAAALAFALLMAFTRLYLGVHFPTDIFAGWALALLLLLGYFTLGKRIEAFLTAADTRVRIITTAAAAFVMNVLHPGDTSLGGLLLGFGMGYSLMLKYFPFSAGADGARAIPPAVQRALRIFLGFLGAGILFTGLAYLFPGEASSQYRLFRFLRYGIMGLWAAAGAPWLFLRLRIAGRREA